MKPATLVLAAVLVAVPVTAYAQIQVGMKVGVPPTTGYDPGSGRDPFVSLVTPKSNTAARDLGPRPAGVTLVTLAVADVKVTGVMKGNGRYHSAIVEGQNKLSYVVKPNDRLLDGVVKSIDALGVVFVERMVDPSGAVAGREIRKLLHPQAEGVR